MALAAGEGVPGLDQDWCPRKGGIFNFFLTWTFFMPTQCALFLRIKLDVQSIFDRPKIK